MFIIFRGYFFPKFSFLYKLCEMCYILNVVSKSRLVIYQNEAGQRITF